MINCVMDWKNNFSKEILKSLGGDPMQRKDPLENKTISELIKCPGEKKCDENAGEWALRHQTDLQT